MVKSRELATLRLSFVVLAALAATAMPAIAAPKSTKAAGAGNKAPAIARSTKPVPLPRARSTAATAAQTPAPGTRSLDAQAATLNTRSAPAARTPAPSSASDDIPLKFASTQSTSSSDTEAIKQAIQQARRGRSDAATESQRAISDPLARKLVEWMILRSDDNDVGFARYNAFITANPVWPSIGKLRRRAEAALWTEKADLATVRAFFAKEEPLTALGRFAYARALLANGIQTAAQAQMRVGWTQPFSRDVESEARDIFGGLITPGDDKARMDRRIYEDDIDAAQRAATRLGAVELAILRARNAVSNKAHNAKALLDAVPASARNDAGYMFSRIQWLRRNEQYEEATRLLLAAPSDLGAAHNTDEWWIERRLIARKLLELDQAKAAYLICRNTALPEKDNYKVESEFMAGWIALRFLNDPHTAAQHFARIRALGIENTTALSRAGYWQGRAAEAAGRRQEARAYYEAAARHATTYYGQLAAARLGLRDLALAPPPAMPAARRAALSRLEIVRAAELLYAINERSLVITFVADLERTDNAEALTLIAELARKNNDARAAVVMGKDAVGRGLPLDHHAFPTYGLPRYSAIGPDVEPAIVYAIARQESAFNPQTVSSANALGLMQVTPAAGRYIAKIYRVRFDQKRLLRDNVYNVQMGAAELGGNIEAYRGSYILAFAAYNAGRGRVNEWIDRFGDPRNSNVDPVDWVERIPFSETRNYVQRIMENLQTYRIRFGKGTQLLIEADIRRGSAVN
ncbi:MAG: lytic transglycosylase domain-containing protein [Xanthobacteraceae bacterium]